MKYPPELRNLVIKNLTVIEAAPKIVHDVERDVFKKINKRCKDFAKKMSWDGSFDEVITEDGGTYFYPADWMNKEMDEPVGGYWLWCKESDDRYWLSLLLRLHSNEFVGFQFSIRYWQLNVGKRDFRKEFLELFEQTPKLKKLGFRFEDHYLMLPFYIDQDELIADPEIALLSVDEALDKIKEAHPILQSIKEKIIKKYNFK